MTKPSTSLLKRRLDIADIVRKNGEVKVDDLAEMLAVSGVTIRSDLNYLEQQGYLKRSFGGAIYTAQPVSMSVNHDTLHNPSIDVSIELELAKQLARLVCDGDTVFLGAGRILRKMLPYLAEYRELCLIVNDLAHVASAQDYIDGELVLLGGVLEQRSQALEGALALQSLHQYQPSCCFLMVDHISDDGTLNVTSKARAELFSEVIRFSKRRIAVVTTRTANGEVRHAVGSLGDMSAIVTPQSVAAEYYSRFLSVGLSNSYTNNACLTWVNSALSSQVGEISR